MSALETLDWSDMADAPISVVRAIYMERRLLDNPDGNRLDIPHRLTHGCVFESGFLMVKERLMSIGAHFEHIDPKAAAEQIFDAHRDEQAWLDAFSENLRRCRTGRSLATVQAVWGLNQAETARLFGVSRQAVSKWLSQGVPAERMKALSDLAAATDLLVRYLKADRIPAVVRRPMAALEGVTLVDLLAQGDTKPVLAACRRMFQFEQTQS